MKKIKLLLVEDSESDAMLLLRELTNSDFKVDYERVETRQKMQEALDHAQWDIIISDYSMPRFSGKEALDVYHANNLDIPFIVISGTIGEITAVEMMKSGAHDFIVKDHLALLMPAIERELQETEVRRSRREAEHALRESELLFRTIVETVPSLLHIMDEDGYTLYISPNCQQITGYTPHEIDRYLITIAHADDCERVREFFRNSFEQQKEVHGFEYKAARKDGSIWYASTSWKAIRDEQGIFCGFVIQTIDITQRKQYEEDLKRVNRALQAISGCNQAMIRAQDETALLQDICRIIVEVGGYLLSWVGYAIEDEAKSIHPMAQYGFEDGFVQYIVEKAGINWGGKENGLGLMGACIRTQRTVISQDISTDPGVNLAREEALRRGYAAIIMLPLIIDNLVFGGLAIYSSRPNAFDPDEVSLLEDLAQDMSFGIQSLRLRCKDDQ